LPPMPKHPGQKIGQRDADREKNGQTVIHWIIMGRAVRATLRQIKSGGLERDHHTDGMFAPGAFKDV
jgi:hypothetical protein